MRYSISNPASSIQELESFLKCEHKDSFIYRGQVTDYPLMIPSFWRKFINDKNTPRSLIDFAGKAEGLNSHSTEELLQILVYLSLNEFLGSAVANLLAQQYLGRSQGLDFTRSIEVACFFGCRNYPYYELCDVSQGIGVVYRTTAPDLPQDAKHWTSATYRAEFLDDVGNMVEVNKFFRDYELEAAGLQFETIVRSNNLIEKKTLYTPVWFVDFLKLPSVVASISEDPTLIAHPLVGAVSELTSTWAKFIELAIPTSRLTSQFGCIVQPRFALSSLLPSTSNLRSLRDGRKVLDPDFAVGRESIGVENLKYTSSLERFYFHHSSASSCLENCEAVWPNASDGILKILLDLIPAVAKKYGIEKFNISEVIEYGFKNRSSA